VTTHYPPGNFAIGEGVLLERATAALPQTATGNLFTITGGRALVKGLYGQVTTAIQAQANAVKVVYDPTAAGATQDLCATLDVNGHAVGIVYTITGLATDAMRATLLYAKNDLDAGLLLNAGTIALSAAASNTGSVAWTLFYVPLDTGVVVAAA
jgi:hypothetical protein